MPLFLFSKQFALLFFRLIQFNSFEFDYFFNTAFTFTHVSYNSTSIRSSSNCVALSLTVTITRSCFICSIEFSSFSNFLFHVACIQWSVDLSMLHATVLSLCTHPSETAVPYNLFMCSDAVFCHLPIFSTCFSLAIVFL